MARDDKPYDRRDILKYAGLVSTGGLFAGCTGNRKQDTTTTTGGGGDGGSGGDGGDGGSGGDGGDSGDGGGGSTKTTTDGTGQTATETEFVYSTTITPTTIDPMKVTDNLETILVHNVYDPLLYYTNETPPQLQSWIAEDWSVGSDERTYTFQLRDDATFHNGDPLTADDVKYSVQRMSDMGTGFSWMWADILEPSNVTVVDETTVKMKTSKVFAPFPFTLPFLFIVNKKQVEANAKSSGDYGDNGDYGTKWLENNDAGSGPYRLTNRQRKQQIVLEKNDDWWGSFADGNAYETVTTEMVQEAATVVGMMKEGSADMSDQWLSLKQYKSLSKTDGVKVSAKATFNPFYIFMHTQREPLSDTNVRKAISYAFNYDTALNDVMAGDSAHLVGPLPSAMWSHTSDLPTYDNSIKKAKKHLEKSNYSADEIDLSYTYVSGLTVEKNMGLLLQTNLDKLGINLEIKKAPWSKITSMVTKKSSTPDMLAIYLSFSYADPDTFLYPAWHTDSHGSWTSASWYSNKEVDKLLTQARQTVGKENRVPLYQKAQRKIADDAPALFVMNQATRNALKTNVQGFKDNGITGYRQTFHWFTQG